MQKTSWSDLPAWPIIVRDLVVFVLVEEVAFYYSHRRLVGLNNTLSIFSFLSFLCLFIAAWSRLIRACAQATS
jgi:hypothetical protein